MKEAFFYVICFFVLCSLFFIHLFALSVFASSGLLFAILDFPRNFNRVQLTPLGDHIRHKRAMRPLPKKGKFVMRAAW
jgi:hypothetical protein